jgi:hypothetical protein
VAKALALLEVVRDLPRTPANVAALLLDTVGSPPPRLEVQRALEQLVDAQFARHAEDGYKLQTLQEKRWEAERRGLLEPRPAERQQLLRELLQELLQNPRLQPYRYKNLRSFRLAVSLDGVALGGAEGIPVQLAMADAPEDLDEMAEARRADSRSPENQGRLFWAFALSPEIDRSVAEVYASRERVRKYERLRAEERISTEEAACLEDEKTALGRRREQLRALLAAALHGGAGIFRGVRRDGSALGGDFAAALARLLEEAVPVLFPKLELGARPLEGDEAEVVLKAVNLAGLPTVCYDGNGGLGLVVAEGDHLVPNPEAPVAQEVLGYLRRQYSYGNRVTGKELEAYFKANEYGWESDLLRLVLAVLLRAGAIEVLHQGQPVRTHQDPNARVALCNTNAFRAASFAPRQERLTNNDLVQAVRGYEALTGQEIDVDTTALAREVSRLASAERERLLPLLATAEAHGLPVVEVLREYRDALEPLRPSNESTDPEEVVRYFLGQVQSLRDARARVQRIAEVLDPAGLARLSAAQEALRSIWPELERAGADEDTAAAAQRLGELLESPDVCERLAEVDKETDAVLRAYDRLYRERHEARGRAFQAAVEALRGCPEWLLLDTVAQEQVTAPLVRRGCTTLERAPGERLCRHCRSALQQLADDMGLLEALRTDAMALLQRLARPEVRVERVAVRRLVPEPLDSQEAVDQALGRLREHLLRLLTSGAQVILE